MTPALSHRLWAAGVLATAALVTACGGADRALAPDARPRLAVAAAALPPVRISEIHYDNALTDQDERVEVSFPVGTDLTSYRIVRYNGSTPGAAVIYTSPAAIPSENLKDFVPTVCTSGGRAVVVVRYNTDGLQNGPNDGLALVNGSTVVELLSYEGPFTVSGTATVGAGMTSTDIGVSQSGSSTLDPIGASLQRSGSGTWSRTTTNTFGACNDNEDTPPAAVATVTVAPATATVAAGATTTLAATAKDAGGQTISGVTFTWTSSASGVATVNASGVVTGVTPGTATIAATAPNGVGGTATVTVTAAAGQASNVRVSEFHYDNESTDTDEKIELEGDVGGSVAGWKLVLYSGSTGSATQGQSYGTIDLTGTFAACTAGGTRGVLVFPATGLQNGDKDGFALVNAAGQVVEFLSYEGSFAAVDGPAAGLTSTDVGVDEDPAPVAGRSLQRAGNGVWFGPSASSFGACNAATPPAPTTGITFTGRLSSDPAIPLGFQDQLFATLRDANTGATIPTTFTWTSETPSIMSVDARGVVTALAVGTGVIRATAADGTTSTLSLPTETPVFGDASLYGDHIAFGAPTDATPADEFRVTRNQYVLSFNKTRNTPNWVAYRLTKANRGDLPGYRCDCFAVDPVVVASGGAAISTADYTGSGFDRGHMVRSNDRELAHGDQATTYYMSNIVPQYANLNQGRWADLESYLQAVEDGAGTPQVYIVAGPRGNAGTIANGAVVVPTHTWKVAVVLAAGVTPASVTKRSDILDVIAVDMPNVSNLARDGNWQAHRVSVDSVEKASGYDVLSALPNTIEEVIESGDRAPTAQITGDVGGGAEGQALSFSAATSSDPDVGGLLDDVLSYQWSVDGTNVGIGPSLSHTFADNGTFYVRLIVADKFGAADTATTAVTVSNVAPAVAAFAGASIAEGGSYTAAGSFTDPGADAWAATVDYGDGTVETLALSGKAFSLAHAYAQDGAYPVTVTVKETDAEAATGSRTATVTVANVLPAVSAFAGATILRGESYQTTGSFTDPGADAWTATVDYGDGTGARPLALAADKSFALSHAYAAAGTFTVTVSVRDDDGATTRTATVVVQSAAEGTGELIKMVNALVQAGTLTSAEGGSLVAKLDAAAKQFTADRPSAVYQVQAFVNEVAALQGSGRLPAADAGRLTAFAQRVIASASA